MNGDDVDVSEQPDVEQEVEEAVAENQDVEDVAPDDVKWDQKVKELRFNGLAPLQERADKWAGTISTLLGVLGTVAFVTGPDSFEKLDPGVALPAYVSILGAGALGLLAVGSAAYAAQGVPKWYEAYSGKKLRKSTLAGSKRAVWWLRLSRWLTLGAIVSLFVGMGIVGGSAVAKVEGARTPSNQAAIVVTAAGVASCGSVVGSSSGELLFQGDPNASPLPLSSIAQLTLVEKCPAPPPSPTLSPTPSPTP